jgi:hypothetical protein
MSNFINNRQYGSAVDAKPVTPSDTVNLPNGPCRAIYVGGAGNLQIITAGGSTATFVGLAAGTVLPMGAVRVLSTSTTATNLLALY